MAQTEVVTDQGIAELILLWREEAATGMESIVALNLATVVTAAVGSTFAAPGSSSAHHTDSGLAIQAIDTVGGTTVNTAGDTITFDHVFTATATKNVAGIHVCNNADNRTFIEVGFNAVLAVDNTDTITIDGQCTINQA